MKKVLQVVNGMNLGGIETFIMNIYRNIDRKKIQFDFLVHTEEECYYDEEIRKLGGVIYSVPARNKGIIKNRNALNAFFQTHKDYEVVHQHVSSLSYIEPLIAAKNNKIPKRIIHGHSTKQLGSIFHQYTHRYNQLRINRVANEYLACARNVADWLYGKSKVQIKDCEIINNGISTDKFIFNLDTRNQVRENLDIRNNLVLGHVGRFSYPKNHDFLIDIFNSVNIINKNAILLLIGVGELETVIKEKVKLFGLEDNVVFLGERSDIGQLLQAIDIFVFPSHYEGLPVTLVEAQAADLPCLVSDNITDEIVISDNIVFKSINQSPQSWADAILNISKKNRINQSEKIINAEYDVNQISKKMMNIYQDSSFTDFKINKS